MLVKRAASGVAWTGTATVVTTGLQFVQLAVLARLLAPEDFGLMAMILVVLGFAHVFADMGMSNAIIHRQDTTRRQLSSLYWLNILVGLLVFGLVVASAPLVAAAFREPRLDGPMVLAAVVILIAPLGQQFQILLQKHFRFRTLGAVEVGAAVAGAATGIGCALAGQGVYSLVWGQLADAAVKALLLLRIGWREWRPACQFRREDLKGYLSFGLYQVGERSANYFGSRLDQLLIGLILGAQSLGYYNLAFNLVMLPVLRLNPILTRVAFPIFAKIQDDSQKLKDGFMALQKILATVNFPLLIGISVIAPIFVDVIFGEQWEPSILLIQILAIVALFRSAGNPIGSLMLAKGRPDLGFYWTLLFLVTQAPTIYLASRYGGLLGISIALLVLQFMYYWVVYFMIVRRLLGPCLRSHINSIAPAVVTSCLMGLCVAGVSAVGVMHSWRMLALQILFGAASYLVLNWVLYRNEMLQMLRLMRPEGA